MRKSATRDDTRAAAASFGARPATAFVTGRAVPCAAAAAGSSARSRTIRAMLGDAGRGRGLEPRDHDFVAAADAERHQRHGAARIGAAATRAELELVRQGLRGARDQRGGTRVDAMRVRHDHRFAHDRRAVTRFTATGAAAMSSSSNMSGSPTRNAMIRLARSGNAPPFVTITGVTRLGRAAREHVEIEPQQQIAGAHAIALAHRDFEPFAAERHGVDADVHRGSRRRWRAQRDAHAARAAIEITSPSQGARSSMPVGSMRDALAEHALRERGVGHFGERRAPAGERREDRTHASASDELELADDPDGIDLGSREPEAQVVSALQLAERDGGQRGESRSLSRRASSEQLGDRLALAVVACGSRARRRASRACAAGCFAASLPIWKLNGIWPTVARSRRDAARDPRRCQIQHGSVMFTRNTARSPSIGASSSSESTIAAAALLELVAHARRGPGARLGASRA